MGEPLNIVRAEVIRKHPLAKCEECPLYETGKYVPSEGPEQATLAFVGEAPGVQEARGGRPFVGPSGQLLDRVMGHYDIKREDVFLSNACLCRPPDNSTPPTSAIRACRGRLQAELDERGVGTAVALGNSAAESLLGQSGVTKLRIGPPKPASHRPDLKVIPTFHPAACLRQADQFPNLVSDVGKVSRDVPEWSEPTYVVPDTVEECLALLDQIDERLETGVGLVDNPDRVLVIDIEVDVEKDTAFDHPDRYGMLCVGIGYDRSKVVVLPEHLMAERAVLDRLGQLLRRWRIGAQNGKFDLAGLFPILGGLELWFDTMLASYCFDERPGIHALEYQAEEHLGAPKYKAMTSAENYDTELRGKYAGYGRIRRDVLYRYNAYDVARTFALLRMYTVLFERDDEGRERRRVHDHLVQASNQLMYVELNGIGVDRTHLDELDEYYIESLGKMRIEIEDIVKEASNGKDYQPRSARAIGFNPNSPLQVKSFLADKGINVDSTNKEVLAYLKEHPKASDDVKAFCAAMLKNRKEAKMHGTYVKGIRKRLYRGRIYSSYLLHGTTTGRLASRNPNMQNIPRQKNIRQIFAVTKPENVMFQTDYSQAELRVLSWLAGDQYFRDIFNDGTVDVFDNLTPILYPNSEWMQHEDPAGWKELRIRVKAYVYGVAYGRSEFSIATEFGISVADARAGMERFFEVIPEIVEFRERTRRTVLAGQDLITPWGRHRSYPLITKENIKDIMNEALAYLPQSTASDACLRALYWSRPELKGIAWIRNTIHDALLVECPRENLEEAQAIVERNMLRSGNELVEGYVKWGVDTKVGKNWGEL
jgi:uracil-DNA glycosylase family 4